MGWHGEVVIHSTFDIKNGLKSFLRNGCVERSLVSDLWLVEDSR